METKSNEFLAQFLEQWRSLRMSGTASVYYIDGTPVKVEVAGFKNFVPLKVLVRDIAPNQVIEQK